MLDKIAAEFCVDPKRVYATGFSSGGAMSTYIACSASDRFAAVVPGGGVNLVDPSCQKAPIPMYAYHGTKDDTAFFNGIDDQPATPNPATAATIAVLRQRRAGHGRSGPRATAARPRSRTPQLAPDAIAARRGTAARRRTQLLLAIGGGHTFPGGTTQADGPGCRGARAPRSRR